MKDKVKVPMEKSTYPQDKVNAVGSEKEKVNQYGANFECCSPDGSNTDTAKHRS